MKIPAALQILTAVMSSAEHQDDVTQWSQYGANDVTIRTDLDLGACLDVVDIVEAEQSQTMYGDADSSDQWVENVIDLTSSEELTSSGDHSASVVPNDSAVLFGSMVPLPLSEEMTSTGVLEFGGLVEAVDNNSGCLGVSDNAVFQPLQNAASTTAVTTTVDFSQLGTFFGSIEATSSLDIADDAAGTTVDVTSLGPMLMTTSSTPEAGQRSLDTTGATATSSGAEASLEHLLPGGSSLWNLDLTCSPSLSSSTPQSLSTMASAADLSSSFPPSTFISIRNNNGSSSGGAEGGARVVTVDVKESLKNRLASRGSVGSAGQLDCGSATTSEWTSASLPILPATVTSATRTLSVSSVGSSSSSLTQSMDVDEAESFLSVHEKREKNRLAAQKCRNRKKDKAESLLKDVTRLTEKQERLKNEVQKLRDERETLEDILNVHGLVCPKIRKVVTGNS